MNYPRLVQPLIYRVLRRQFLTVIRRSFLTGRGHIDSPRCQSVRRRTSRSHTGYQRFPIPLVQVALIVRKSYLTIVSHFIRSNQSSSVHLSLRGAPFKTIRFHEPLETFLKFVFMRPRTFLTTSLSKFQSELTESAI